jgi:hypothetical protein
MEIILWAIIVSLILQGSLSLWFVRWILWRNQALTELIVWKKTNGEKLDVLAQRFRIGSHTNTPPAPTPEPEIEPEPQVKPDITHLEIADINLTLHE